MKVAAREIESFVKKPPPSALAVLVYGPDEGLVRERATLLVKTVVEDVNDPFNVADIPGDALKDTPSRLLDEAKSMSMLGGRRVVRVRGGDDRVVGAAAKDALAALSAGDNLVVIEAGSLGPRSALRLLFEGAKNAAAVPCYVDDARGAGRIIADDLRAAGYRISPDALGMLAANVTGDRAIARGEAEKLMTYMGAMKDIGPEDVAACVGGAAAIPLDDLARHTAAGRFGEADRILQFALSEGTQGVVILRTLQNHFLRLHLVQSLMARGESMDMAMKKLKPQVFFKQKPDFESQVSRLGPVLVERALVAIATAEAKCKQTGAIPELIVGRLLLSLSQMCARAAARRRA